MNRYLPADAGIMNVKTVVAAVTAIITTATAAIPVTPVIPVIPAAAAIAGASVIPATAHGPGSGGLLFSSSSCF